MIQKYNYNIGCIQSTLSCMDNRAIDLVVWKTWNVSTGWYFFTIHWSSVFGGCRFSCSLVGWPCILYGYFWPVSWPFFGSNFFHIWKEGLMISSWIKVTFIFNIWIGKLFPLLHTKSYTRFRWHIACRLLRNFFSISVFRNAVLEFAMYLSLFMQG